jgi:hypothetical protein
MSFLITFKIYTVQNGIFSGSKAKLLTETRIVCAWDGLMGINWDLQVFSLVMVTLSKLPCCLLFSETKALWHIYKVATHLCKTYILITRYIHPVDVSSRLNTRGRCSFSLAGYLVVSSSSVRDWWSNLRLLVHSTSCSRLRRGWNSVQDVILVVDVCEYAG